MSEPVRVPVSLGELFDKITILQIKRERMKDAQQLANVGRELALLEEIAAGLPTAAVRALMGRLGRLKSLREVDVALLVDGLNGSTGGVLAALKASREGRETVEQFRGRVRVALAEYQRSHQ